MRKIDTLKFYGNEVSEYAKKMGYVDYETLSKAFGCVRNNDIIDNTRRLGIEWELVHGSPESEVAQSYIISSGGYEILKHWTDEIVLYSSDLDMYVWEVTHWGTAWDYVLTDIKIDITEA